MRNFISRIPRPKVDLPVNSNPHCMTLAVWQPPPIISPPVLQDFIPPAAPPQTSQAQPIFNEQNISRNLQFEISERGDNLSPERMDTD